ncbi:MarR family winged helix-turn-helix transcriptional regulator [Streptomyces sp. NPDC029216]|uniref:MarR family winged helix-turn-helix transcriptional regulator n=1 Tax=Streptomyces sp. NPDC029216 TaxID=3154701 RepID=UPI0033E3DFD2
MSMQRPHWLWAATVRMTVSRECGSRVVDSKTVDRLVALGYAERIDDAHDARRKLVHLTPHGRAALHRSAAIFDELRREVGRHPRRGARA